MPSKSPRFHVCIRVYSDQSDRMTEDLILENFREVLGLRKLRKSRFYSLHVFGFYDYWLRCLKRMDNSAKNVGIDLSNLNLEVLTPSTSTDISSLWRYNEDILSIRQSFSVLSNRMLGIAGIASWIDRPYTDEGLRRQVRNLLDPKRLDELEQIWYLGPGGSNV